MFRQLTMNLSTFEPTQKLSKLYGSQYSTKKNYAPSTVPNQGVTATTSLFNRRKAATQAAHAQKEALREDLKKEYIVAQAKADRARLSAEKPARQYRRDQYAARIEERDKKFHVFVHRPVNLSPVLDMQMQRYSHFTNEQRVREYSRRHKCPHGFCFTSYKIHESISVDQKKTPIFMQPTCSCPLENVTSKDVDHPCGHCTARQTKCVSDTTFPGEVVCCLLCKTKQYQTIGWSYIRPLHLAVAKPMTMQLPSTKTWEKLPTISAEKQLGVSSLTEPFMVMWDKIVGFFASTRDWIVDQVVDAVAKKLVQDAWGVLVSFLERMREVVLVRPAATLMNVWTLLTTESSMARYLCLAALLEDTMLENIWTRMLCALGLKRPSHRIEERVQRERVEDSIKEAQRVRDACVEVDDYTTLTTNAKFWNLVPGQNKFSAGQKTGGDLVIDENGFPVDRENVRAEKQFGVALFDAFFGFVRTFSKSKYVFEFVKDFNVLMSGWKNLHELVNNLISVLPSWLTKLFIITDPKKRYGVESRSPGNPIYDMVQAYSAMLTGEGCASPSAFEEFKRTWQVAEIYMTEEYPADGFVMRLHKLFFSNALAIMQPGTHGAKPIPYVVTFFGVAGTGKSSTWPLIMSGVIKADTVEEIREMSYTRNPVADHYDGYNPQKHKVFVLDDFGSQIDDESAGELMSIVSSADFLPPYASVDNPSVGIKGTSFASPIVILCSNFRTFSHCKQIADKVALQRRLGVVVEWNDRFTTDDQTYALYRTQPDGQQLPLTKPGGGHYYTMTEMQNFFRDDFVKHMKDQMLVNDAFNKRLCKQPLDNFMDLYTEVRNHGLKRKATAEKQLGGARIVEGAFKGIAALGVVAATYALADYIDEKGKLLWQGAIALAGAAALCFAMWKLLFSSGEQQSGENSTAKSGGRAPFARASKQNGTEQDDANLVRITRNHVVLVDQRGRYVNGLFVKGRIALTVKHFLKGADRLIIHSHRSSDTSVYDVLVSDCKIVDIDDVDLALIEFPSNISPFADILNRLAERPFAKTGPAFVTRRTPGYDLLVREVTAKRGRVYLDFEDSSGNTYTQMCELEYAYKGTKGDCGNVLMAEQDGCLKVIGMHESASLDNPNQSFAAMVNRAEIEVALKKFSWESQVSPSGEFKHEKAEHQEGTLGMNKCSYVMTCGVNVHASGNTDLRPSTIHDRIHAHTTEPAILRKERGLDPMMQDLAKYGTNTDQFPDWAAKTAVQSITEELMALKEDFDLDRELTIDECINGIPAMVESIDTSTSSGYPWTLTATLRGPKRKLLSGEPGHWSLIPAMRSHYDEWQAMLDSDIIPNDPFMVTLKDERRKLAKVKAGSTRVFCAGSFTGFLHNKRLFGAFGLFFKRVRGKCFSVLGLNRASLEWHQMIGWMREVGRFGLDGDQKHWDGRFKVGLAFALLELFAAFYGDTRETRAYKERYMLFAHALFPNLRFTWQFSGTPEEGKKWFSETRSYIMQAPGAMPSGWYLTFVLNSLVNATMMRVAWILLVSAPFNDLRYFRENVRDKFAGDDSFLAVSDNFLDEFNNITIAEMFALYGQTYTPATKGDTLLPYQKLTDCSFLKTTTGVRWDRYVPLFDRDANLETMNWIRKCDDERTATENNCNDVLRNSFFYGEEEFNALRAKMLACDKSFNLISFHSLETAYLGYGVIPDPFGSFAFTRSATKDPANFYKSVQKSIAQMQSQNLRDISISATKQSGERLANMSSQQEPIFTLTKLETKWLRRLLSLKAEKKMLEERVSALNLRLTGLEERILNAWDELYQPVEASFEDDLPVLPRNNATHACRVRAEKQSGLTTDQPIASGSPSISSVTGTPASLDESTPNVTSTMGVHLAEQQEIVDLHGVDGNARSTMTRANAHLDDDDWTLSKMLERENLVAAFTWDITDPIGADLTILPGAPSLNVPEDLLQNDLSSIPFERFQYARWEKLTVRIQLVASRFHQGRLLVYFDPSMVPRARLLDGGVRGPIRATQLQHCFLDPSNGTVIDFEIPFRYHKAFLDLVAGDVLGQLHCQVLNQLQVATGATTALQVKIFAKFQNVAFRVPRPGGTPFAARVMRDAEALGYTLIKAAKQSGVGALLGGKLAAKAGAFVAEKAAGSLVKLAGDVLPKEVTGAIAGILLDKPAVTEFPVPLTNKDAQYMSASRGIENLERMTLEPSAMYLTDDQFGDSVDEMDMKYLMKKPVFIGRFNWAATDDVGTTLYTTTVSPMHLQTLPTSTAPFEISIIPYFTDMFTYWRGGFDLTFQMVGTAFHEGRLDFCFHPGADVPPVNYNVALSQYVDSQTIRNNNNEVRVRIPFLSDIPWKRVWGGQALTTDPNTTDFSMRFSDFCLGTFTVRVSVPLKNPNNVANNIDVNVFLAAADDYEVNYLSLYNGEFVTADPFSLTRQVIKAVKQSGDLNTDKKTDVGALVLSAGQGYTHDVGVHHFGESYHNLREIAKRYQTVESETRAVPGIGEVTGQLFIAPPGTREGFIQSLSQCYRLFRGPMNFKTQVFAKSTSSTNNYNTELTGFITTIPQPPYNTGSSGGTVPCMSFPQLGVADRRLPALVRFSTSQVAEYQVPFQSIYHSLLVEHTNDNLSQYYQNALWQYRLQWNVFSPFTDNTRTITLTQAMAFADETRFGVFTGVPVVQRTPSTFYPNTLIT